MIIALSFIPMLCHAQVIQQAAGKENHSQLVTSTNDNVKNAFLQFVLDKATKYSGKVEDVMGKAVDVASKEAPEMVHEYLLWHFLSDLAPIVIAVVTTFSFFVFSFFNRKKYKTLRSRYDCDVSPMGTLSWMIFFGWILSGIGTVVTFCIFCTNILEMIQILVAPRIYILDQVINLVSKHN